MGHSLESAVRLATLMHQGRPRVGRVLDDAGRIALYEGDGACGLLPLIGARSRGAPWPEPVDEIAFEPRWRWVGPVLAWVYRMTFRLRHRNLRRLFKPTTTSAGL